MSWMAYSCEPLPILPLNLSCNLTPTGFLVLAGSSSSLSIMSGVSFEAVARIGGRYWSVPPSSVSLQRSFLLIISLPE